MNSGINNSPRKSSWNSKSCGNERQKSRANCRTLGRSTTEIFRTVLLPAALPHIAIGLRIGIATALLVGIASEMLLSSEGLGNRVVYAQRTFDITGLYAGVLTLATLGFLLNRAFMLLEARVLRWHAQSREKSWS